MSQSSNCSEPPSHKFSSNLTSRIATSAIALAHDACAVHSSEIGHIPPFVDDGASSSKNLASAVSLRGDNAVVDHVPRLSFGPGGLAARRRNRAGRSVRERDDRVAAVRGVRREGVQFQQFLHERGEPHRTEVAGAQVVSRSPHATPAQGHNIQTHPSLTPIPITTSIFPPRTPPQFTCFAAQTPADDLTRPQQIKHSRHLERQSLLQQNAHIRLGAKQWAATRLSPCFKPDYNLSDDMITESQRLFDHAIDNPHFVKCGHDGAIVPYECTQDDINPVLGACIYIAQFNLGTTDAGMSTAQICKATSCHVNDLIRWSQILRSLIRPERRQERRVPEGPGMNVIGCRGEMPGRSTVRGCYSIKTEYK